MNRIFYEPNDLWQRLGTKFFSDRVGTYSYDSLSQPRFSLYKYTSYLTNTGVKPRGVFKHKLNNNWTWNHPRVPLPWQQIWVSTVHHHREIVIHDVLSDGHGIDYYLLIKVISDACKSKLNSIILFWHFQTTTKRSDIV